MMTNHYDKMFFVDEYVVTRLQTGNWDQETTDEDIEEIGNPGIVETIIDPIIPSTVTLNTNDWGATDFLAQLMGSESTVDGGTSAYIPASANRNDWTIDEAEVKLAKVDMLVRVRNTETLALEASVWIPNCQIQTINWSYSVDGNATENVTLRGDTDRHFVKNYRQTTVEIGVYVSGTTFDTTTTQVATQQWLGLYYTVNGTIYDATGYTWVDASQTVDISGCTAPPTLATGDRIRWVYYRDTPDDSYTELDTLGIGAIKAPYVVIGLGDDTFITSASKTLRLQSVDVNVNLTREDIKEIGTEQLVASVQQKQDVTVDATVLEGDMENLAKIMGISSADWATGDVEFKLQDAIGNFNDLIVKVYDDSSQTSLLKTLTCTGLALLNNPFTQDVGALGQYTLSFRGDNWLWEGNGDTTNRLTTSYPTGYPLSSDQ
jgi:hypothetical protein